MGHDSRTCRRSSMRRCRHLAGSVRHLSDRVSGAPGVSARAAIRRPVPRPSRRSSTMPARRSAWSMRWSCCRSWPSLTGVLGADWARLGGVLALVKMARYARASAGRRRSSAMKAARCLPPSSSCWCCWCRRHRHVHAGAQRAAAALQQHPGEPVVGDRHHRHRRLWRHDADHRRRAGSSPASSC